MNYPTELKYSKSHEWLKLEDSVAVIGISDFAQDALGDVVFIELPQVGDTVTAGERFGDVESVKAVSELISPVSGVICEVNDGLEATPEELNADPYGAWILRAECFVGLCIQQLLFLRDLLHADDASKRPIQSSVRAAGSF